MPKLSFSANLMLQVIFDLKLSHSVIIIIFIIIVVVVVVVERDGNGNCLTSTAYILPWRN